MAKLKIALATVIVAILFVAIIFSMMVDSFHGSSFSFTHKSYHIVVIEQFDKEGYSIKKWELPKESIKSYGVKQYGNSYYFVFVTKNKTEKFKITESDFELWKTKDM